MSLAHSSRLHRGESYDRPVVPLLPSERFIPPEGSIRDILPTGKTGSMVGTYLHLFLTDEVKGVEADPNRFDQHLRLDGRDNLSYGLTADGRAVLLQPTFASSGGAVLAMLAIDQNTGQPPAADWLRALSHMTFKSISAMKEYLTAEEFPFKSALADCALGESPLEDLDMILDHEGGIVVQVSGELATPQFILVDQLVKVDRQDCYRIRVPFHGLAITVPVHSLMTRLANNGGVYEFLKPDFTFDADVFSNADFCHGCGIFRSIIPADLVSFEDIEPQPVIQTPQLVVNVQTQSKRLVQDALSRGSAREPERSHGKATTIPLLARIRGLLSSWPG